MLVVALVSAAISTPTSVVIVPATLALSTQRPRRVVTVVVAATVGSDSRLVISVIVGVPDVTRLKVAESWKARYTASVGLWLSAVIVGRDTNPKMAPGLTAAEARFLIVGLKSIPYTMPSATSPACW